eukprot:g15939.t1
MIEYLYASGIPKNKILLKSLKGRLGSTSQSASEAIQKLQRGPAIVKAIEQVFQTFLKSFEFCGKPDVDGLAGQLMESSPWFQDNFGGEKHKELFHGGLEEIFLKYQELLEMKDKNAAYQALSLLTSFFNNVGDMNKYFNLEGTTGNNKNSNGTTTFKPVTLYQWNKCNNLKKSYGVLAMVSNPLFKRKTVIETDFQYFVQFFLQHSEPVKMKKRNIKSEIIRSYNYHRNQLWKIYEDEVEDTKHKTISRLLFKRLMTSSHIKRSKKDDTVCPACMRYAYNGVKRYVRIFVKILKTYIDKEHCNLLKQMVGDTFNFIMNERGRHLKYESGVMPHCLKHLLSSPTLPEFAETCQHERYNKFQPNTIDGGKPGKTKIQCNFLNKFVAGRPNIDVNQLEKQL